MFFDEEIAHAVWSQTLDEVEKGETEGPIELVDVPEHRRFGVKQNDKIRCVDDFTWSGINPAESPKPHTLDVAGRASRSTLASPEL